jgi:hypothetical protein
MVALKQEIALPHVALVGGMRWCLICGRQANGGMLAYRLHSCMRVCTSHPTHPALGGWPQAKGVDTTIRAAPRMPRITSLL